MNALSDTIALCGRNVRHIRRAPGKLIGITLTPLVTLLIVGYLFKNSIIWPVQGSYQEYIMAGIAAQVGLASIGPTATGVAMDLRGGLIDRFRSLPISRTAVLVGHTLSDLMVAAISLCTVLAAGYALGWRPHDGLLPAAGAFGLLLAFTYAMLWIGVVLGLLVRNVETIQSRSCSCCSRSCQPRSWVSRECPDGCGRSRNGIRSAPWRTPAVVYGETRSSPRAMICPCGTLR